MTKDNLAIHIHDISKIYRLWNSPKDKLVSSFTQWIISIPPFKWLTKNKYPTNNYREFYALKNISFKVKKSDSWGFLGVNGSGKSTLLKIISGNLQPSSGYVEIDGKVVILDYGDGFNGEFTGSENIYIKASLLGLSRKKIKERYKSIIDFAELGDFINQPVKTYSSGMMSRLGFAIIAHIDADIIITDEALAVGDVFFVQKCMKFIHNFLKKGTFLFVSHSINDVVSLCQNALWLNHGMINAIGPASKVAKAYLDSASKDSFDHLTLTENEKKLSDNNKNINNLITVLGKPMKDNYDLPTTPQNLQIKHINTLNQINDIHLPLFEFNDIQHSDIAKILKVAIYNEDGKPLTQMIGGELVSLNINIMANSKLKSPIAVFQILDRLGQILFSGDSYLTTQQQPYTVESGNTFTIKFTYVMPLLPPGSYVAQAMIVIINGKGATITLDKMTNALVFHSVTTGARHGLVGIPMLNIKLRCQTVAS